MVYAPASHDLGPFNHRCLLDSWSACFAIQELSIMLPTWQPDSNTFTNMLDPSFVLTARTRYPRANVEALSFLRGDPTRAENEIEKHADLKANRKHWLLSSEHQGKAIFSTNHGQRPKRLCYKGQPKNITSNHLEDVLHEATRLQEAFPDDCMLLSPATLAGNIAEQQEYFDNFDINYFGEVFLVNVLSNIAHANVIERDGRADAVNDFAYSWIHTNPEAFCLFGEDHQWVDLFCQADVQHYGRAFLQDAFWRIANIRDEAGMDIYTSAPYLRSLTNTAAQMGHESFSNRPAQPSETLISPKKRPSLDPKHRAAPGLTIDTSLHPGRYTDFNRVSAPLPPTPSSLPGQLPYLMAPAGLQYPLGLMNVPEEMALGLVTPRDQYQANTGRSFADNRTASVEDFVSREPSSRPGAVHSNRGLPQSHRPRAESSRWESSEHASQTRQQRGNYSGHPSGRPIYMSQSMRGARNPTKTSTDDARLFSSDLEERFRGQYSPQKNRRPSFQKNSHVNGQPRTAEHRSGDPSRQFEQPRFNRDYDTDRRRGSNPYTERPGSHFHEQVPQAAGAGYQRHARRDVVSSSNQATKFATNSQKTPAGSPFKPPRAERVTERVPSMNPTSEQKPRQSFSSPPSTQTFRMVWMSNLPVSARIPDLSDLIKDFTGYRNIHALHRDVAKGTSWACAVFQLEQQAEEALPGLKDIPYFKTHNVTVDRVHPDSHSLAMIGGLPHSSSNREMSPIVPLKTKNDSSTERDIPKFTAKSVVETPSVAEPDSSPITQMSMVENIDANVPGGRPAGISQRNVNMLEIEGNNRQIEVQEEVVIREALIPVTEKVPSGDTISPIIEDKAAPDLSNPTTSLVYAADTLEVLSEEKEKEAASQPLHSRLPFDATSDFPTLAESVKHKGKTTGRKNNTGRLRSNSQSFNNIVDRPTTTSKQNTEQGKNNTTPVESALQNIEQSYSLTAQSLTVNEALPNESQDITAEERGFKPALDHHQQGPLDCTQQNLSLRTDNEETSRRISDFTGTTLASPTSPSTITGTTIPCTPNEGENTIRPVQVHGQNPQKIDFKFADPTDPSKDPGTGTERYITQAESSVVDDVAASVAIESKLPPIATSASETQRVAVESTSQLESQQSSPGASVFMFGQHQPKGSRAETEMQSDSAHPSIPTRKKKVRTTSSTPTKKSFSGMSNTQHSPNNAGLQASKIAYPRITEQIVTVLEATDEDAKKMWACEKPSQIFSSNHGKTLAQRASESSAWLEIMAKENGYAAARVLSSRFSPPPSASMTETSKEVQVHELDPYMRDQAQIYIALEAKLEAIAKLADNYPDSAESAMTRLHSMPMRARTSQGENYPLENITSWREEHEDWIQDFPDDVAFGEQTRNAISKEANELGQELEAFKTIYLEAHVLKIDHCQQYTSMSLAQDAETLSENSRHHDDSSLDGVTFAKRQSVWNLEKLRFLNRERQQGRWNEEQELPAQLRQLHPGYSRTKAQGLLASQLGLQAFFPNATASQATAQAPSVDSSRIIFQVSSDGHLIHSLAGQRLNFLQALKEQEVRALKIQIAQADRQLKRHEKVKAIGSPTDHTQSNVEQQAQLEFREKGDGPTEEATHNMGKPNAKGKSKNKKKKGKGKKTAAAQNESAPSQEIVTDTENKSLTSQAAFSQMANVSQNLQHETQLPPQFQNHDDTTQAAAHPTYTTKVTETLTHTGKGNGKAKVSPSKGIVNKSMKKKPLSPAEIGQIADIFSNVALVEHEPPNESSDQDSATQVTMQPGERPTYTKVIELLTTADKEDEGAFRARVKQLHEKEAAKSSIVTPPAETYAPEPVKKENQPVQQSWAAKLSQGQEPAKEV